MTRILFIDHDAVQSADRALYRALSTVGDFDVTLVVPKRWFDHGTVRECENEEAPLRVKALPVLFAGRPHRVVYRGLRRLLREMRPEIVVANAEPENFLALQTLLACACWRTKPRIVLTSWRNIDYRKTGFPYRMSWMHVLTDKFVLRRCDHIVAHNEEAKRIFEGYGFDRASVILPFVDLAAFANVKPRARTDNSIVVGYIGRLVIEKGVDLLFNALELLPRNFRLVVIGHGTMEKAWRSECVRRNLSDRVTWHGPHPRKAIPELLAAIDVLVLPSRTTRFWKEQFGRVLIEAMAAGVAVVGSDSGEIPKVIGESGIVVPEGDHRALARALESLAADDVRFREMRDSGKQRVKAYFSLDIGVQKYRELLLNAAGQEAR